MSESEGGAVPAPARFKRLLSSLGWERLAVGPFGEAWGLGEAQIAVPNDWQGDRALVRGLLTRVGRSINRDPDSLWVQMLVGISDVLSTQVEGTTLDFGLVPLAVAGDVVSNARRLIKSVGTSVLTPVRHINRRYRSEAQRLAKQSYMAHTREGSFVFPLYIPLDAAGEVEHTEAHSAITVEPYGRTVTRRLSEALALTRTLAVEQAALSLGEDDLSAIAATGITHETCQALVQMLASESLEGVVFNLTWAPVGEEPPNGTRRIEFDRSMRQNIRTLGQRLADPVEDRTAEYTGTITDVHQPEDPEEDDYFFVLQTYHEARRRALRVNIDAETKAKAATWFTDRNTVLVRGVTAESPSGVLLMRSPEWVKVFITDHLTTA